MFKFLKKLKGESAPITDTQPEASAQPLAPSSAAPVQEPTPGAGDPERLVGINAMRTQENAEQLERKTRSIRALQARGIRILETLPGIATTANSVRRSDAEVAGRALALMCVALKGETGDQALVETVIGQYGAVEYFTGEELGFLGDPEPTRQDRVNMTWRYEGVKTLLWAIDLLDELGPEDTIADAAELGNLFRSLGTDGLFEQACLRPQAELLDATDHIYRLNWAMTDARVNGEAGPSSAHAGVVYERHYALNWLIGYAGLDWDDMRTDT